MPRWMVAMYNCLRIVPNSFLGADLRPMIQGSSCWTPPLSLSWATSKTKGAMAASKGGMMCSKAGHLSNVSARVYYTTISVLRCKCVKAGDIPAKGNREEVRGDVSVKYRTLASPTPSSLGYGCMRGTGHYGVCRSCLAGTWMRLRQSLIVVVLYKQKVIHLSAHMHPESFS